MTELPEMTKTEEFLKWISDQAQSAEQHIVSLPESCQPVWFRQYMAEKNAVTDEEIAHAEEVLGFGLSDWQKDYVRAVIGSPRTVFMSARQSSKKTAQQAAAIIAEARTEKA